MNATAKNARDIKNAIELARQQMFLAKAELDWAVAMMANDYEFAGNPDFVSNCAGTLNVLAFSLIPEIDRWNGYANARKD